MKLNAALTTLVSLTTLASASALPNVNFRRQNVLSSNSSSSTAGSGANIAAVNTNLPSSVPFGNATLPSAPGSGAGIGAVNTAPVTTTVVQTVTTTVAQQYTTFAQTNVVTATVIIPAGGNGVGAIAPGSTQLGTPVYFVNGQLVTSSGGSGTTGSTGSGSGTGSSGSTGSGSGSGSGAVAVAGTGSSGPGSGAGSNAGSVCVCSAAPAVVATGIYTVTVQNVVNLGSTTYTTAYPTTTLGVITVAGGSIVPAVATVTQYVVPAANTNAVLPAGQSYQTIAVPASGTSPAYTIVVIVTVINNVVVPVNGAAGNGVGAIPATTNGAGNGVGALPASTAGPFSNSTISIAGSGAGVAALGLSTNSALPTAGSGAGVAAIGLSTSSATSSSATQASVGGAIAATSTPVAVNDVAPAPVATNPATSNTGTQVGSLGNTPLYNQPAFINDILGYHNELRARNGAPPMTWNQNLANIALNNVNANAQAGTFLHSRDIPALAGSDPYGENIANQYGANNPNYLVWLWYEENQSYDYTNGGFAESTGHFTQVVWVASTELGCAYTQAADAQGTYYLACEYNTPGNFQGQFQANVLPQVDMTQPPPQPAQPAANAA